ncbi:hypothetical protein ASE36_06040 [Rhizobium sp. Root274]|uniref:hypothetical protein n=1 Tax=unclassified Rhizobium TaxID=2613769 RepID=UPI000713CFA1|nr:MULTISPECIES: hypothetical protein [unclassified Rhizobium]KQW31781.1 hypothetical protein ASC71_06045 [Rhizobium sp. Root1240]KRD33321.1 hypothetical protein ASE36_06040 [Rhizobium sp. Root274]
MNNLILNTNQACRVVGIDPDRLNENVSAGRMPCLPKTIRGRSREFSEHDLLTLYLFRKLLDRKVHAKMAGQLACWVSEKARSYPDARYISIVETAMPGNRNVWIFKDIFKSEEILEARFAGYPVEDVQHFDIKQIRETIARRVAEELGGGE